MGIPTRIVPRGIEEIRKEGWFASGDIKDTIERLNIRLESHGLQIVEGTDEDGNCLGGDWWFRIVKMHSRETSDMEDITLQGVRGLNVTHQIARVSRALESLSARKRRTVRTVGYAAITLAERIADEDLLEYSQSEWLAEANMILGSDAYWLDVDQDGRVMLCAVVKN